MYPYRASSVYKILRFKNNNANMCKSQVNLKKNGAKEVDFTGYQLKTVVLHCV